MSAKRSVLCMAAFVAMMSTACSKAPNAATPHLSSAQVGVTPARAAGQSKSPAPEEGDDDGPAGVLVVSADLVRHCPNLQALKDKPPTDEAKAWLVILQSVAECMNAHGHQNDRILLTGGKRPDTVIRYVLTRMGVSQERVDMLEAASSTGDCPDGEDCNNFAVRIDLAPAKKDDREHL